MKKNFTLAFLLTCTVAFAPSIDAQIFPSGQSLNGSTGLFSIPTARVGWEDTANVGLDFGFRSIINDAGITHIPSFTATFFGLIELSAAFDFQPDVYRWAGRDRSNEDLLFGMKIQLPTATGTPRNPAIALGVNAQLLNFANDHYDYNAIQPYIAFTSQGVVLRMPAETTIVFGKTFYPGSQPNNSNIDFGIGINFILFPDVFGNFVNWIIDFSNFDYSSNAWPNRLVFGTNPAWYRGNVSTGFRLNFSTLSVFSSIKFLVDIVFNDLFDDGSRSFTIGTVLGVPIR
ncbi:MAG: hypothetical protein FWG66_13860 [Spirochaetes bacterium]|nr:hypothetical protein [Spirochaetota bacterium]